LGGIVKAFLTIDNLKSFFLYLEFYFRRQNQRHFYRFRHLVNLELYMTAYILGYLPNPINDKTFKNKQKNNSMIKYLSFSLSPYVFFSFLVVKDIVVMT
jgi:hypothetical protein